MPLLSTDRVTAAAVSAQGFDAAEPGWTGGMQDLEHQFIRQKCVVLQKFLASARHGRLQVQITLEPGDLAVRRVGILLHAEQLLSQQSLADRGGVEAAIPHQPASTVGPKSCWMDEGRLIRGINVAALHLPLTAEPIGIDQVISL